MNQDQRRAKRHQVRFKLVYDDGNTFNAGRVADVSSSGLFLETALPLPVGTKVRLTPLERAAQDGLFNIEAEVVRAVPYADASDQPAGMGLAFLNLSPEQCEQVVALIHTLEDQAAHATKTLDLYLGVEMPDMNAVSSGE